MKYGLLTYTEQGPRFNIGDYVQSLAAKQFLPRVDALINREEMALYDGDPIKIILNGWFTHNIDNWLPSEKIHPLFISFHVNSSAAPYILNPRALDYLKRFEPIGCRDRFTVTLLEEKGIRAYFSGCLTLTLSLYAVPDAARNDIVYIVDPFYNYPSASAMVADWIEGVRGVMNGDVLKLHKRSRDLKRLIDDGLLKSASHETQVLQSGRYSDEEKFAIAEALIKKYARAKLVITSRIHAALPCLAMGTPVIFVNGFNAFLDTCRFDGIVELFNRVDVDGSGNFKANFPLGDKIDAGTMVTNSGTHLSLSNSMKEKCKKFIEQGAE